MRLICGRLCLVAVLAVPSQAGAIDLKTVTEDLRKMLVPGQTLSPDMIAPSPQPSPVPALPPLPPPPTPQPSGVPPVDNLFSPFPVLPQERMQ